MRCSRLVKFGSRRSLRRSSVVDTVPPSHSRVLILRNAVSDLAVVFDKTFDNAHVAIEIQQVRPHFLEGVGAFHL
jgi:hypothetical protein